MSTSTKTTTKVVPLAYSPVSIRAALIAFKGAEKGPATFEACAPVFSAMLASGGSKAELSVTTATAQVFKELHSESLKTPTARAFRATCAEAIKGFSASGRAKTQEDHDNRLLALSAMWCAFFRDVTPKTKAEGQETPKATIARLQAELVALRVERDALAGALASMRVYAGERSDAARA